jgi:hypothetical protein
MKSRSLTIPTVFALVFGFLVSPDLFVIFFLGACVDFLLVFLVGLGRLPFLAKDFFARAAVFFPALAFLVAGLKLHLLVTELYKHSHGICRLLIPDKKTIVSYGTHPYLTGLRQKQDPVASNSLPILK